MNEDIKDWLNKLIGSEIVASLQYEIAAKIATGTDYDSCATEFAKHAEEEREHYIKLMECAVERDLYFDQDVASLIVNAYPKYMKMVGKSTKELVTFHFHSEESAIVAYKEFYNIIKDRDITLAQCIKDILHDEIEHRKDMKKIFGSIEGIIESAPNDSPIFESFSKRISKINKHK